MVAAAVLRPTRQQQLRGGVPPLVAWSMNLPAAVMDSLSIAVCQ